jgi:hypothetical protein
LNFESPEHRFLRDLQHDDASTIEIEIAGAHVRLRGPVDDASLRLVLSALRDSA